MSTETINTPRRARRRLRVALAALALPAALAAGASTASAAVQGNVFQDFNSNGVNDAGGLNAASDAPISGITVRAFNAGGTQYGPVTTNAAGDYSLPVPNGVPVRVEFSGIPAGWWPSFAGSGSGTAVQFAKGPAANVDFGLNIPAEYCQANPLLAINCFVSGKQFGDGANKGVDTLVSVPYGADDPNPSGTKLATAADIGTTWGLAWDRTRSRIYTSAFMKRHTGFGPSGTGAIYSTDPATGTTSLLFDVNSIGANYAGADPHPTTASFAAGTGVNTWHHDANSFDSVGKISLGDLDISDDDSTLFSVDLATRELLEIPVVGPTAGAVTRTAVPVPAGVAADDVRPFAVKVHRGTVYVGLVNSAESTGNAADLKAWVYEYTPGTGFGASVIDFPLNYGRGCAVVFLCPGGNTANWGPWQSAFTTGEPAFNAGFNPRWQPQPMLTDIEFGPDGSMILGLRDRWGDQIGNFNGTPDVNDATTLLEPSPVGDVLRAAPLAAGGWGIESNSAAPAGAANTFGPSAGGGTNHGPGGGEFYFQDQLPGAFDETALGGLAQVPGYGTIAQTQNDPSGFRQGGVTTLSHTDGSTVARNVLTQGPEGDPPPISPQLGKASSLADVEALCEAAPLQIGNRFWIDTDRDGKQDPGEPGITGVVVWLVDANGNTVGTTKTGPGGTYFFDASNVPGGINPMGKYTIRVPLGQAKLRKYDLTKANRGSHDGRDSDALIVGKFGDIMFMAGKAGQNNHTYDVGFVLKNTRLKIVKTAPKKGTAGKEIVYKIKVTNRGPFTAQNVVVSDPLPKGLALIKRTKSHSAVRSATAAHKRALKLSRRSYKAPGAKLTAMRRANKTRTALRLARNGSTLRYANANGSLTFKVGNLAKGKSKTIILKVKVLSSTRGNRTNKAIATASNAPKVSNTAKTRFTGVTRVVLPAVTG